MIFGNIDLRVLVLALLLGGGIGLVGPASVEAQQQPQQDLSVRVDSIVVRGNARITDTRVIETSRLRSGTEATYPDVQEAIRRLFETGEFSNVQVSVTPGDPAVFYIDVEEQPLVARYEFRGLESIGASTIRDSAGLVDGAPLQPGRVNRARSLIRELLSEEGFPRPAIDTAMHAEADGYRFVYEVDEGPRLGIAAIEFEGNESFSDEELRGAMRTGEEGFLWFRSGELREDEYRRDLRERLPEFYASHGFIDFSVADDSIRVDRSTGKGRVLVRVEEGPRYLLSEFTISGNRRLPSDRLRRYFRSAPEEEAAADSLPAFDRTAFQEATSEIEDLYRNLGYLRARVIPTVERVPASDGEPPRVVASWNVEEGDPAYIRRIDIVGNDYTHDRIIRQRLSVFPGDIYSQARLVESMQRIQSIGFFEALPPGEAVEIQPRDDGDVDITIRVQEKQTGNLNFGLSASALTGLAGFIGYEQPNLFGQAKSGSLRLLFGGRSQDIEANYSDPELFGSDQSVTVGLRRSRDQFRTFGLGERRQTGGSIEVGTPVRVGDMRSTRAFIGYSLFRDEVGNLDFGGVSPEDRNVVTSGTRSTINLRLVRDTRRGGTFPTAGGRSSLSARLSGGPLGGTGQFGKYEFESEWFVPVAQLGDAMESVPIDFTAGLSVAGGVILGNNPFFRERFYMGGTQIGQELRGYEESTVTPAGHVPRNVSFSPLDRVGESYFKTSGFFGVKLTGSLFASAFVDAGNVWESPSKFNPADLLTGAGVGVTLISPFGPLGLDYAYGFDRRDALGRPDPGWKLHFKFGRVF